MADFVKVRSVDAPGEYFVARSRAVKFPDRYVIVDGPPVIVVGDYVPDTMTITPEQATPTE